MSGFGGQMSNMVLVLGLVQVAKHLNLEDEGRSSLVIFGFAASNLVILLGCLYLRVLIKQKNDLTALKYKEPASVSHPQGQDVETTFRDHDLAEVDKQMKSVAITMAMLGFMNYKWGFIQPLFLQSVLPLKTFFTSNLVKIHLFHKAAVGDLTRPWKAENPFEKLTQAAGANNDTTAPAVEASGLPKFEELSATSSGSEVSDSDAADSDDEETVEPKKDK
ncbi:phosphate transporter (Pho88) [Dimargaris cristalligena]|uniref:Phosphate transport-domain-containing protein n=1 Tax=Dimargaris cristalligena TaxID=215637 RepID=A0A4V1J4G8_9FUNG|nr:phosphate transporter (Pho88) [Dimargaris cristalligena]RKP35509.1 phosphate transport-domain-containing protein [Dimargaris cristalligena]|eukprot:RKP35509.1 phosphate transport-domain-containing protein [Dimargaris cristalligena]